MKHKYCCKSVCPVTIAAIDVIGLTLGTSAHCSGGRPNFYPQLAAIQGLYMGQWRHGLSSDLSLLYIHIAKFITLISDTNISFYMFILCKAVWKNKHTFRSRNIVDKLNSSVINLYNYILVSIDQLSVEALLV